MKVIIAGRGMPHNAETVSRKGLGGSETAQVCMAIELARLGCEVTNYVNLAPPDEFSRPELRHSRGWHEGVQWKHVDELLTHTDACDVLVVCRNPDLINLKNINAKAKILWVQDFACEYYPRWASLTEFKRILFVSKWQRDQWDAWRIHQGATMYPPGRVTRNGIMRHESMSQSQRDMEPLKDSRLLVFASRPERGLEPLVRPGGVLDRLPSNYQLIVCGYDDYPHQYAPFYEKVWGWAKANPKIKLHGSLANRSVRGILSKAAGLVLPTDYPETSCMLAREAMEVQCPVFATAVDPHLLMNKGGGALEETLQGCGWIHKAGEPYGSDAWCEEFAAMIRHGLENPEEVHGKRVKMLMRSDLYWDTVARTWLSQFMQILEHEV